MIIIIMIVIIAIKHSDQAALYLNVTVGSVISYHCTSKTSVLL